MDSIRLARFRHPPWISKGSSKLKRDSKRAFDLGFARSWIVDLGRTSRGIREADDSVGRSDALIHPSSFLVHPSPCQKEVNAVKRLAVSTGRLRALLLVHLRPIDLVVFQEPMP